MTRNGIEGARPGREATTGVNAGRHGKQRGGETPLVPRARFRSYYGKPIINRPVWAAPDIPGYLFLGGLAGACSLLGAGAALTGREQLAKTTKVGAFGAISLGMVGLVHDLGRPGRFLNMLRVFKPTSPMNLGSWLLSAYGPAAGVAALTAVAGRYRLLGATATIGAAATGPFVAAYTAALLADTAVPAWHDAYRELPFIFVGSGASAAGGLAMIAAPLDQAGSARLLAAAGAAAELGFAKQMERRLGEVGKTYQENKAGRYMRAAGLVTSAGAVGGLLWGGRSRSLARFAGAALMLGSALTRWGIFHGGLESAANPEHTVGPQRERLRTSGASRGQNTPRSFGAMQAGAG